MAKKGEQRPRVRYALACIIACGMAGPGWGASLEVRVLDNRGEPLGNVAIYAVPSSAAAGAPITVEPAVMDQASNAFVPHLLIVQTGTPVLFPNNDTVSHHVYSFSEAKTFELGLYKGNAHPPLLFDKPGVVVLGCNIHDGMLGYIVVVDSPYFALTDSKGKVFLAALPEGNYTVHAWTPRAKPADLPAAAAIAVGATAQPLTIRLNAKLQPAHDHGGSGLSWQRY
jgi:plastocyanin